MSKEKLYDVIKKPLITEKSVTATENGKYTFETSVYQTAEEQELQKLKNSKD